MAKEEKTEGNWVFMVHKDFSDRAPTRVTRKMFDKLWKEKGWTEFKGTEREAQAAVAAATPAVPENTPPES